VSEAKGDLMKRKGEIKLKIICSLAENVFNLPKKPFKNNAGIVLRESLFVSEEKTTPTLP